MAWPAPQTPAPVEPVVAAQSPARIVDDETLVRQAIERFRLTYNARLLAVPDSNRPATLVFEPCEMAWLGETATAVCRPLTRHPEVAGEPWLVTLDRTDGAWAIRSVQSP